MAAALRGKPWGLVSHLAKRPGLLTFRIKEGSLRRMPRFARCVTMPCCVLARANVLCKHRGNGEVNMTSMSHATAPRPATLVVAGLLVIASEQTPAASESFEFVAEHLPEAAMDNRFATLPLWNHG